MDVAAVPTGAVDATHLAGSMSGDLSIPGLFMQADLIVKIVICILALASVWSWTIIFDKRTTLKKLNSRAGRFEDSFWSGEPLDKLYERVKKGKLDPLLKVFCAGMEEWQNGVAGGMPARENMQAGLKQRVERSMSVSVNREMGALERGMTFLASVGSTATFIGLFGTVWGIMNSFTSIAHTNNTSLAVVAPGIAEALFATALGLVAAIPAVLGYNALSSGFNRYGDRLDAFTVEFGAILSRHLESHEGGGASRKVA